MTTHPVCMTEHAPTRVSSGILEALKVGSCKSGFGVESQIEMVNALSPSHAGHNHFRTVHKMCVCMCKKDNLTS